MLSLARLWGEWHNIETGDPVKSCTIIATAANDLTRKIHDRMTVIVAADDLEAWLSGSNFSDRRI